MLIHIINHYRYFGQNEFTILAGIKIEFMLDYFKSNFEEFGTTLLLILIQK